MSHYGDINAKKRSDSSLLARSLTALNMAYVQDDATKYMRLPVF